MKNYTTLTEIIYFSDDSSEEENTYELKIGCTTDGLTAEGTLIVEDGFNYPNKMEQGYLQESNRPWAQLDRFEEFSACIKDWSAFRDYFVSASLTMPYEDICNAEEWLHGGIWKHLAIEASELKLVESFLAWQTVQKKKALLQVSVPTVSAQEAPRKPVIKV